MKICRRKFCGLLFGAGVWCMVNVFTSMFSAVFQRHITHELFCFPFTYELFMFSFSDDEILSKRHQLIEVLCNNHSSAKKAEDIEFINRYI